MRGWSGLPSIFYGDTEKSAGTLDGRWDASGSRQQCLPCAHTHCVTQDPPTPGRANTARRLNFLNLVPLFSQAGKCKGPTPAREPVPPKPTIWKKPLPHETSERAAGSAAKWKDSDLQTSQAWVQITQTAQAGSAASPAKPQFPCLEKGQYPLGLGLGSGKGPVRMK